MINFTAHKVEALINFQTVKVSPPLGQTKLIFCFSDFSIKIVTRQAGTIKIKI